MGINQKFDISQADFSSPQRMLEMRQILIVTPQETMLGQYILTWFHQLYKDNNH